MAMFTEKGQGALESESGLSIISIRADERIEIQSTSVVHGDIAAKRLLVQEGGEINGVVRMGEAAIDAEPVEKAGAQRSY